MEVKISFDATCWVRVYSGALFHTVGPQNANWAVRLMSECTLGSRIHHHNHGRPLGAFHVTCGNASYVLRWLRSNHCLLWSRQESTSEQQECKPCLKNRSDGRFTLKLYQNVGKLIMHPFTSKKSRTPPPPPASHHITPLSKSAFSDTFQLVM